MRFTESSQLKEGMFVYIVSSFLLNVTKAFLLSDVYRIPVTDSSFTFTRIDYTTDGNEKNKKVLHVKDYGVDNTLHTNAIFDNMEEAVAFKQGQNDNRDSLAILENFWFPTAGTRRGEINAIVPQMRFLDDAGVAIPRMMFHEPIVYAPYVPLVVTRQNERVVFDIEAIA